MSDLIENQITGINEPEFSVSEISNAIKRLIEDEFSYVRIRGEIGRVSFPRSGHVYLDLKDEKSVISGVIWKGVADRLVTRPEEGMEVIARGRVTTFGGQSKYQIIIDELINKNHKDVTFLPLKNAVDELNSITKKGDIILTLGAGDIWRYSEQLGKHFDD